MVLLAQLAFSEVFSLVLFTPHIRLLCQICGLKRIGGSIYVANLQHRKPFLELSSTKYVSLQECNVIEFDARYQEILFWTSLLLLNKLIYAFW